MALMHHFIHLSGNPQRTWPGILTFGGLFVAGLYLDIP